MPEIDELLSQIPIDEVARQLGVDRSTAEEATRAALPALVGGMQANTEDPAGARSLADAIAEHDPDLVEGGVKIEQIDTADGDKIVSHVFGANRDQVVNQLGGLGGSKGGDIMGKLLPILAPVVMAFLAKRMFGGGSSSASASPGGEGGLGDILGGLLGGGGGGGLGDILGGLLGGGRR